jgi:hypothetical protein
MKIRTRIFKYSFCLPLVLGFGLLSMPPHATAQAVVGGTLVVDAPPEACDADAKGEEILQAAKSMNNAACNSAAIVASDRSGFFSAAAQAKLNDVCTRSQNWVNNIGRSDDFARMGKKGSADCYIAERDDCSFCDGDGICSPNEKYSKQDDEFGCVEDDSDAFGDNDGICELREQTPNKKKKVWEECLEICDTPEGNSEVTDCAMMDHMSGSLQDAADALDSANTQLVAGLQVFETLQKDLAEAASDATAGSTCLTASSVTFDGFSFPNGSRANEYTELRDALLAAEVLEGAANVCSDVADTTVFGTDAKAVCGIVHSGLITASTIANGWELLDDAISGARVDKVSLCVQDMGSQLNAMQEQLKVMDGKLDTIMEYLNTPQGRRPWFPLK